MRIFVLDRNFDILGSIPLYRTLIWTRRYEMPGCFEMHLSGDGFPMLSAGRYLYRNDALELGVIDEVGYSQDENGGIEAYIKGNFAEVLLAGRVVGSMAVLSGSLEGCMRELVRRAAIEPDDPGRAIPHLKLGEASGLQGKLDVQTTGAVLSDKLYEVGNTFGVSHRVRYDFQTNDLLFEVWQGKDRRDSQEEHSWAVFSNAFCNVRSMSYTRDGSAYRNFAYVAGAGEGMDRVTVPVDMVPPGGQRQEIWVDARDLQPEDAEGNAIPLEDYKAQLVQRGREKLAGYPLVESVEACIDPDANLAYRKDFDLGDLCTYINADIGISVDKRITEVVETYEGGAARLDVTFGSCGPQTVRQLIRREA